MKRVYFILIAGMMILSSCNEPGRGSDLNEAADDANSDKFGGSRKHDADFVYEVIGSDYGEIKLAELGNQKSRSADIRKIAQTMLADHVASLNELKVLAQSKAISVPVEEPETSKRSLESIAEENGEEFDRIWCKEMADLHDTSIDKFEKRLEDTQDDELKAYISKTLPVLKKHHEHLKSYDTKFRKSQ